MNRKAGHAYRQAGFTLIELVVIIAIIGIMMVALSNMMIDSLRAKNRVKLMDRINENGTWISSELRKNLLRSPQSLIICKNGVGLTGIGFGDDVGSATIITCKENQTIASSSARPLTMTDSGIAATGCNTFVTCVGSTPDVTSVTIKFTLGSGVYADKAENKYRKTFESVVTVRD
jgi:prepilin-type N-terminal cleavage/methylation domain-containing protein